MPAPTAQKLRAAILADPGLLARVEAAIHPLVAADRAAFLDRARAEGRALVLCDIPLLYETGAERWLDRVAVVTAPAEVQRARVLSRPGMTEACLRRNPCKTAPGRGKEGSGGLRHRHRPGPRAGTPAGRPDRRRPDGRAEGPG